MKIIITIQARCNSERLPHKVFLRLPNGKTVLEQVVSEALESRLASQVVVTTPDVEIVGSVKAYGAYAFHYQSGKRDLLDEFMAVAKSTDSDYIVRLTADCPLLTSEIIDNVIAEHLCSGMDYSYNHHDWDGDKGDGFDVEVFTTEALYKSWYLAKDQKYREHLTSFMRDNLKKQKVEPPDEEGLSLNTWEDYQKICRIFEERLALKE